MSINFRELVDSAVGLDGTIREVVPVGYAYEAVVVGDLRYPVVALAEVFGRVGLHAVVICKDGKLAVAADLDGFVSVVPAP